MTAKHIPPFTYCSHPNDTFCITVPVEWRNHFSSTKYIYNQCPHFWSKSDRDMIHYAGNFTNIIPIKPDELCKELARDLIKLVKKENLSNAIPMKLQRLANWKPAINYAGQYLFDWDLYHEDR